MTRLNLGFLVIGLKLDIPNNKVKVKISWLQGWIWDSWRQD
jgi:hypothetical protein